MKEGSKKESEGRRKEEIYREKCKITEKIVRYLARVPLNHVRVSYPTVTEPEPQNNITNKYRFHEKSPKRQRIKSFYGEA